MGNDGIVAGAFYSESDDASSVQVSTSRQPVSDFSRDDIVAATPPRDTTAGSKSTPPSEESQNSLDSLDTWTPQKSPKHSDDSAVQTGPSAQAEAAPSAPAEEVERRRDQTTEAGHAAQEALESEVRDKQASVLEWFNERYAFTEIGNESRVPVIVEFDGDGDLACRRRIPDFHKAVFYTHRKWVPVLTEEGVGYVQANKWWLEHPDHRWHRRIVLAPPGSPLLPLEEDDYNLWRDFAVDAKQGDWSKNAGHIHRIICDGDDRLFEWLQNWMAALVQKPGQHGWVAPLLKGGQGIGKGHFAEYTLGRLFRPRQYAHLGGADELTGQFTEHLSGKVLVYADESVWGNKVAADALKRYITEDTIMIHPKHFPRFEEVSNLHIIIASNAETPLPVERDDRRLAVLQVSEAEKNHQRYFRELREELDHGGRAAMLHDLVNLRVNDDWLREPPTTAAKSQMKAESLGPADLFLQERLQDADTWDSCVIRDDFHQKFTQWLRKHRYAGRCRPLKPWAIISRRCSSAAACLGTLAIGKWRYRRGTKASARMRGCSRR